jgi:hypothetical protein
VAMRVERLPVAPSFAGKPAGLQRVQLVDLVGVVADRRGRGEQLAAQARAGAAQMLPQGLIVSGEGAKLLGEQVQLILDHQGGRRIMRPDWRPVARGAVAILAGKAAGLAVASLREGDESVVRAPARRPMGQVREVRVESDRGELVDCGDEDGRKVTVDLVVGDGHREVALRLAVGTMVPKADSFGVRAEGDVFAAAIRAGRQDNVIAQPRAWPNRARKAIFLDLTSYVLKTRTVCTIVVTHAVRTGKAR